MAFRVLLADPDRKLLRKLKHFLERENYIVDLATDGKEVQLSAYKNKYFAIVLNTRIKNHSGLQVLRFIRTNYPAQKILIILEKDTSEEENKTTTEILKKYRVEDVLIKPFSLEQFEETLKNLGHVEDWLSLVPKSNKSFKEEEVALDDKDFSRIKIDELYFSKVVFFDVFIRISSSRYIKILYAGDKMDENRVKKYRQEKNVKFLYFKKKDIGKYVKFSNFLAQKILLKKDVPCTTRINLIKNISSKYLEHAFYDGLKPGILDQGKELAKNICLLIERDEKLSCFFTSFTKMIPKGADHSFLVSLFSTALIRQFKWQSKKTIETVALACILHDIGKMKLPKNLIEKRIWAMSDEELKLYQQHPILGAEMVENCGLVTNTVKQIIIQHHEYYDGSGYPLGKCRNNILTLSNIVCISDDFVHIITDRKILPVDALEVMFKEKYNLLPRYNPTIVENFIKIFVDKRIDNLKKPA